MYLDQWVWIRLAKAANGEPKEASDLQVLAAVRDAAAGGVAFPLSATHHVETSKIKNPRQRLDLARTMASISYCRTLRARQILLRHQMLRAMHVTMGRPTFRPEVPEVLGTGVHWAFLGEPRHLVLRGPDGVVDPETIEGMPRSLRKANQLTELMVLAGPDDAEIGPLRDRFGYRPEAFIEVEANRLSWEASYVDVLADHPASRAELRVRLQARELLHEHLDLFQTLIREHGISLTRDLGSNPDRPRVSRQRLAAFADAIPSLRIAVDLKVELFRNASKSWSENAIHDIDALSIAVPYCHVVVPDREMATLLARSHAAERHGTLILAGLAGVPAALHQLAEQARNAPGDRTGWDWAGPWDGYCLDWSELLGSAPNPPAA